MAKPRFTLESAREAWRAAFDLQKPDIMQAARAQTKRFSDMHQLAEDLKEQHSL